MTANKTANKTDNMNNSRYNQIGCVIMASGLSSRFGNNKLLASFRGKYMIQHILDAAAPVFENLIVVTRSSEVASLCEKQGVKVLLHEEPGRNNTVRLGLDALCEIVNGDASEAGCSDLKTCIFCPSDQPFLTRDTFKKLADICLNEPDKIWRAAAGNRIGTPSAFPAWTFDELRNLPFKKGGGYIMHQNPEMVSHLQVDELELVDIDTQADYLQYQNLED